MKIVALTGSIGSGKSAATQMFADLKVPTLSADLLAREVVVPGSEALQKVRDKFGAGILNNDGSLNRKLLGEIVFADASRREVLEQILHPKIRELFQEKILQLSRAHPEKKFLVYEIPLFFESNYPGENIAAVVVVHSSEATCIKRIMQRDNCSELEARQRLNSQIDINEKVKKADFVISNEGSFEDLRLEVQRVYEALQDRLIKNP